MIALRPHTTRQARTRRTHYAAPALEKGLDFLELLASIFEALSHREIAGRLGRTVNEVLASYQVHGVVNISYPIFNQHREAIAAMAVPFLAHIGDRVGPPQAREALCAASQALSAAIGGNRLELTSGALQ